MDIEFLGMKNVSNRKGTKIFQKQNSQCVSENSGEQRPLQDEGDEKEGEEEEVKY